MTRAAPAARSPPSAAGPRARRLRAAAAAAQSVANGASAGRRAVPPPRAAAAAARAHRCRAVAAWQDAPVGTWVRRVARARAPRLAPWGALRCTEASRAARGAGGAAAPALGHVLMDGVTRGVGHGDEAAPRWPRPRQGRLLCGTLFRRPGCARACSRIVAPFGRVHAALRSTAIAVAIDCHCRCDRLPLPQVRHVHARECAGSCQGPAPKSEGVFAGGIDTHTSRPAAAGRCLCGVHGARTWLLRSAS